MLAGSRQVERFVCADVRIRQASEMDFGSVRPRFEAPSDLSAPRGRPSLQGYCRAIRHCAVSRRFAAWCSALCLPFLESASPDSDAKPSTWSGLEELSMPLAPPSLVSIAFAKRQLLVLRSFADLVRKLPRSIQVYCACQPRVLCPFRATARIATPS